LNNSDDLIGYSQTKGMECCAWVSKPHVGRSTGSPTLKEAAKETSYNRATQNVWFLSDIGTPRAAFTWLNQFVTIIRFLFNCQLQEIVTWLCQNSQQQVKLESDSLKNFIEEGKFDLTIL
jgi:hypothetical protein